MRNKTTKSEQFAKSAGLTQCVNANSLMYIYKLHVIVIYAKICLFIFSIISSKTLKQNKKQQITTQM